MIVYIINFLQIRPLIRRKKRSREKKMMRGSTRIQRKMVSSSDFTNCGGIILCTLSPLDCCWPLSFFWFYVLRAGIAFTVIQRSARELNSPKFILGCQRLKTKILRNWRADPKMRIKEISGPFWKNTCLAEEVFNFFWQARVFHFFSFSFSLFLFLLQRFLIRTEIAQRKGTTID